MTNPVRSCVACCQKGDKGHFLRVVRETDGKVSIDIKQKKQGRGAYICKKKSCMVKTLSLDLLSRHLRTYVPDSFYQKLKDSFGE